MINWKPEYNTDIQEIDKQHVYFLSLMNKLYEAIQKQEVEEKINQLIEDLKKYKEEHFKTEEEYFEKYNYPGTEEHKKAHQDLRNEIEKITNNKEDKDIYEFSYELLDFLENWLVDHLESMDGKYVEFFKNKIINNNQ